MKTIEPPKFIINTIKNDDEIKHYIKSVSVENDENRIELIMNTELLYGDVNYY
jgi:hypothetical protein